MPKNKLILSLFSIFLYCHLSAQQSVTYFSDGVKKGSLSRIAQVVRKDESIYIGGSSFDTLSFAYTPSITKLDTSGATIWTYSLNKQIDSLADYQGGSTYVGWEIQLMTIDDSAVYVYLTGHKNEIWKISQRTGDLLWRKNVPDVFKMTNAGTNYISYDYNSSAGYVYELIDKSTGKTTLSKAIAPALQNRNGCYFLYDQHAAAYMIKGDSVIKYSSPTLETRVWNVNVSAPGAISAAELMDDGYLYFAGSASILFTGRLAESNGLVNWIGVSTYNPNVLQDFLTDIRVAGNFVYLSGEHVGVGSVFTAYHICKFSRDSGHLNWEEVYNPYWPGGPTTDVAYVGANTLDADANGSVYVSGYEQAEDNRTGVWGICKFSPDGVLVYHNLIFDGSATSSSVSRGRYTFVLNNRVFHLGELQRDPSQLNPATNYDYSNVCLIGTDTGSVFAPYKKLRCMSSYQEFSDVLSINNLAPDKFAVLKQTGSTVTIELRKSLDNEVIWTKEFKRGYYFEADKMCVTADNKIAFSAFTHDAAGLEFDHSSNYDSIYFFKLDSTGALFSSKGFSMANMSNFKPIQLYPSGDTSLIYVYSQRDTYNNPLSIQLYNVDRASRPFGDFSNYIASIYSPIEGKQELFVSLSGDSALHFQYRPPLTPPINSAYNVFVFNTTQENGCRSVLLKFPNVPMFVHNLAICDTNSVVLVGDESSTSSRIIRINTKTQQVIWDQEDFTTTRLDMASCSKNAIYLSGRYGPKLSIRQVNKETGAVNWDKLISPPNSNAYFMPLNQKYNPFRGQYIVAGYITDTTNVTPSLSCFYITVDSNGNVIKEWIQEGDYKYKNSLKALEVTQFGQTLLGGALYREPYGRSGVFIEADSVLHIAPVAPIITATPSDSICQGGQAILTAQSINCAGCSYSWSTNPVSKGTSTNVATSGVYTVTAENSSGSASTSMVVTVSPVPSKPTISKRGNMLMSSAQLGNQWYVNGRIIPGADGQVLVADSAGSYTVQVIQNGCASAFSDPLSYTTSSTSVDSLFQGAVIIYPNPVIDLLHINNMQLRNLYITIYDMNGRIVTWSQGSGNFNFNLSVGGSSMYYIVIIDLKSNEKAVKKILRLPR